MVSTTTDHTMGTVRQLTGSQAFQALQDPLSDKGVHQELTVFWPKLGRKVTYLPNANNPFGYLQRVIAKAKEQNATAVLRVFGSWGALSNKEVPEAEQSMTDARLWKEAKLSVRAVEQFREYAPQKLQCCVDSLVSKDLLSDAVALVRPYAVYKVQADDRTPDRAKTIAVDFDGVIANISEEHDVLGDPIPGAIDGLNRLVDSGYDVVVMSSRAGYDDGRELIERWLEQNGAPPIEVTALKIPAEYYLDDHALQFTGWENDLPAILDKQPTASLACPNDGSYLLWKSSQRRYQCPACDESKSRVQTASAILYQFAPGDKVHVRSVEGKTLGDAYLMYRASSKEEMALKADNLWLVKFVNGPYLPVGEEFLSKMGSDENVRVAALTILNDGEAEPSLGNTNEADLDMVVETVLSQIEDKKMPVDMALAVAACNYKLDADIIDEVSERILCLGADEALTDGPEHGDLLDNVRDALDESDLYFQKEGLVPSADDEVSMIMDYLGEAFHWQDELLDEDLAIHIEELVRTVREEQGKRSGTKPPRWVTSEHDRSLWDMAVGEVAPEAGYAAMIDLFRVKKNPRKEETTEQPIQEEATSTNGPDEYMPVALPSLESVPEGEYDVVRFQTVAGRKDKTMSITQKVAALDLAVANCHLNDEQKNIVADIREHVDSYSESFLRSLGQFFTYEWDPGSSWQVIEVEGKRQIVRSERTELPEIKSSNHSYKKGQELVLLGTVVPTQVMIMELLGDDRYRVKSQLDGSTIVCDETDLFQSEQEDKLFW